jgi:hypothetical protein
VLEPEEGLPEGQAVPAGGITTVVEIEGSSFRLTDHNPVELPAATVAIT